MWGLDSGVILSTGKATDYADGPNLSESNSTNFGYSGSSLLSGLSGFPTYDAVSLKFDFMATSNNVSFDFVFGSEEYAEYVGSSFNDAFGVWLTDSACKSTQISFDNKKNPITINTAWMKDSIGTELDGDTGILTTTANVLKGKNYTLEFLIADSSDGIYDSTVYLSNMTGVAPKKEETVYGLFLGDNDGAIKGANDAISFKNKLTSTKILEKENTKLLTSDFNYSDVLDAINDFDLQANDSLYFYYSGHGGAVTGDGGETTKTNNDEHISWGDGLLDYITDDELAGLLTDIDDINKWIFLDSCKSGGFWGNGEEGEGDLEILNNIALIAATSETWYTAAGLDGTGLMTSALLDGLEYNSAGFLKSDYDQDGFVTISEWDKYLNSKDWYMPLFGTYVYEKDYGDLVEFNENMIDIQLSSSAGFSPLMDFYANVEVNSITTPSEPVPEPATMLLLGSGLIGLAGYRRKLKK